MTNNEICGRAAKYVAVAAKHGVTPLQLLHLRDYIYFHWQGIGPDVLAQYEADGEDIAEAYDDDPNYAVVEIVLACGLSNLRPHWSPEREEFDARMSFLLDKASPHYGNAFELARAAISVPGQGVF